MFGVSGEQLLTQVAGGVGWGVTLTRGAAALVPGLPTGLALVALGTGAVEVLGHAVAPGLVLARVGLAGVGRHPRRDLRRARTTHDDHDGGDNNCGLS